jgi:isopenicillin N synthase-like dioxygenase
VLPPQDHQVVRQETGRCSVVFFHHSDRDTSIATVEAREHVMVRHRNSYPLDWRSSAAGAWG